MLDLMGTGDQEMRYVGLLITVDHILWLRSGGSAVIGSATNLSSIVGHRKEILNIGDYCNIEEGAIVMWMQWNGSWYSVIGRNVY